MGECVAAIGNFDGVHRGHQSVIKSAVGDGSLPLVVLTFWPHPVSVIRPEQAPKLLCDLETRIELLRAAGAHEVRVIRFNPAVAQLSPADFVSRYLSPLAPQRVVVGQNFRFGHRASGDVTELAALGRGEFEVTPLPLETVDDLVTCSTLIREALAAGQVATAAEHLGREFQVRGVVEVGDQRGRELGFPTANLTLGEEFAVPSDGVYAGWVKLPDGQQLPAAISVGTNPTFDGRDRRVESYVLDRDDLELYGVEIAVTFVERLRGQVKFDGVPALIEQMNHDVAQCREVLSSVSTP